MAKTQKRQLADNELVALQEYAAKHGRTWKSSLRRDWMNGHCAGELHAIRNEFGPSWLQKFKLPKIDLP